MARLNVASDACDGARGLHRGDEMVEEALLGALECRSRRRFRLRIERAMLGARHPRRLHRRGEIVVDDLEGTGIAVVDASLLVGELMFEQLIFDRSEERRVGKECVSTCRSRWSP